jgi:hypothetical protein
MQYGRTPQNDAATWNHGTKKNRAGRPNQYVGAKIWLGKSSGGLTLARKVPKPTPHFVTSHDWGRKERGYSSDNPKTEMRPRWHVELCAWGSSALLNQRRARTWRVPTYAHRLRAHTGMFAHKIIGTSLPCEMNRIFE